MKRIIMDCSVKVPSTAQIVWDNIMDSSHFRHRHWKRFKAVEVIERRGHYEALYYNSYVLPPLPITRSYVTVREGNPDNWTVRQLYHDIASRHRIYLEIRLVPVECGVVFHSHFVIELGGILAWFPRLFAQLVYRRLYVMYLEDLEIWKERAAQPFVSNPHCAPGIVSMFEELRQGFDTHFQQAAADGVPQFTFEADLSKGRALA